MRLLRWVYVSGVVFRPFNSSVSLCSWMRGAMFLGLCFTCFSFKRCKGLFGFNVRGLVSAVCSAACGVGEECGGIGVKWASGACVWFVGESSV